MSHQSRLLKKLSQADSPRLASHDAIWYTPSHKVTELKCRTMSNAFLRLWNAGSGKKLMPRTRCCFSAPTNSTNLDHPSFTESGVLSRKRGAQPAKLTPGLRKNCSITENLFLVLSAPE